MKLTCNEALDILLELDEGTLEPSREKALRDHLDSCESCQREYRKTMEMLDSVKAVFAESPDDIPASFNDQIWAKIDRKKRERTIYYQILPVAAAVFLAVAVNMFGYFSRSNNESADRLQTSGIYTEDYGIYVAQNYLNDYDVTYLLPTEITSEQDVMLDELSESPSVVFTSEDIYNIMDDEQIDNMLAQYER